MTFLCANHPDRSIRITQNWRANRTVLLFDERRTDLPGKLHDWILIGYSVNCYSCCLSLSLASHLELLVQVEIYLEISLEKGRKSLKKICCPINVYSIINKLLNVCWIINKCLFRFHFLVISLIVYSISIENVNWERCIYVYHYTLGRPKSFFRFIRK